MRQIREKDIPKDRIFVIYKSFYADSYSSKTGATLTSRVESTLLKHAYSNILKISPPKIESFPIKNLIVFIFLLKT